MVFPLIGAAEVNRDLLLGAPGRRSGHRIRIRNATSQTVASTTFPLDIISNRYTHSCTWFDSCRRLLSLRRLA